MPQNYGPPTLCDTHLFDILNGAIQESSHVVNERVTICNAKIDSIKSACDKTHVWILIIIAI